MAKYYLDTEFLEGTQKNFFGKSKPTIDLVSIGLVAEDGREYYAISKEFNLKEAWNRYQMKEVYGDNRNRFPEGIIEYWIRENVLKKLFNNDKYNHYKKIDTFQEFKNLVNHFGKTNKQIAEELCLFIDERYIDEVDRSKGFIYSGNTSVKEVKTTNVEFYGYYCDYDWVAFCWLFGKMIDLPKGFPMYCRDLKQELDRRQKNLNRLKENNIEWKTIKGVDNLTSYPNYPKQANEHNALADARWTFELYKFLEQL